MNEIQYHRELLKCVRCGACKAPCPTYSSTLDETMGARGRVSMLGALEESELLPSKRLSDKIFSCILCEACRDICPTGIDIPEAIYNGRSRLKDHYRRGRLLSKALKFSLNRMDAAASIMRVFHRFLYPSLYRMGRIRYIPEISPLPFTGSTRVYRNTKKIGRISVFAGCSVNYLYPNLGEALLNILLTKGYEVVILKGEVCCGAPLRSFGLEKETAAFASKNIELFNKMNVEAILSICPTCTMTIKRQYPLLTGGTIEKIMDVNEFFVKNNITEDLKAFQRVVTFHDPCHLRYGLGIKDEPRAILRSLEGIRLIEMQGPEECCGFGGFFSVNFKKLSKDIGKKKLASAGDTWADTIITSCPGCMMQLEDIKRRTGSGMEIMHIIELIDEAMHD
jgi:glycolate oxidase iron-sulfur subunit